MKMNITMDPKNKKRRADRTFDNDSDSDYEIRTRTMNWPHLLVESGDDSLPVTKLSPFATDKGFQALISGRQIDQATQEWNLLGGVWHEKAE